MRQEEKVKNIFKYIALICLFLAAVEIGLRINFSRNFNNTQILTSPNKAKVHIIVYGDSVSEGYPALLERKLNNRSKKQFSVINRSGPELDLKSVIIKIPEDIKSINPDSIVIMLRPKNLYFEQRAQSTKFMRFISSFMIGRIVREKLKQASHFISGATALLSDTSKELVRVDRGPKHLSDPAAVLADKYISEKKYDMAFLNISRAVRLDPNNRTLYERYAQLTLMAPEKVQETITVLNEVKKDSLYKDEIDHFIAQLETLRDDKLTNPWMSAFRPLSAKMAAAISVGQRTRADEYFLKIDEELDLNNLSRQFTDEFEQIIKILKANDIPLVMVQFPDQRVEGLVAELGTDKGLTYFDTYSILKDLVLQKKYSVSDLFKSDGIHLTDLGNEIVAEAMVPLFIDLEN